MARRRHRASVERPRSLLPTRRQKTLLGFIEKYQMENGCSPLVREMRRYMRVRSDNSVLKLLAALKTKGYIQKTGNPRGVKILPSVREALHVGSSIVKLPLIGSIPAGSPVLTEEYVSDYINIGKDLVYKEKGSFLLNVKGESMIGAGIMDGDIAIVCNTIEPREDDIVVALIDNENTLKRLIKRGGKIYLQAENPKYSDLIPLRELQIQGVVTGIIRKYK